MSEKIRIGEYKGFELWDTPPPEGWSVHSYPVQVTCNGEHVNNFADANEAMSVIDGMDADTIAYHMRRSLAKQPAPASATSDGADVYPSAFAQAVQGDDRLAVALYKAAALETEVEASYTRGYEAGLLDGYTGVDAVWVARFEARQADLESKLAAAQAERDAARDLLFEKGLIARRYIDALEPFAELYRDWLVNPREIEFFDYLNRYRVSDELLAIVMNASVVIQEAQQATGGEDTETET